jgi:hypothetical protein
MNANTLDDVRRLLANCSPGPFIPSSAFENSLAGAWDFLAGEDGGMNGMKLLGRMEDVVWQPPRLTFRIERHGGTVLGSSRAEVQEWTVDLEQRTKVLKLAGRRQVRTMQCRFDEQPLAQELADAILAGRTDERLKWDGDNHVRLLIGKVLPEGSAVKETLGGRRKRLREAVAALLGAAEWKMVKSNVFEKLGAA